MGGSSSPKPPPPTPEEKAMEYRTNLGLRNERKKTETMLKNQARSKLGVKSLLGGIEPDTSMKQKDVKHSNAISSEKRSFNKLKGFERLRAFVTGMKL